MATAIAGKFDHDPHECVHDLRNDPHSGYRAVHIWLKQPARVEIQIRTHLQGRWANMYEAAADVLGREIRYGALPTGASDKRQVENLHALSHEIKELEDLSNEAFLLALAIEDIPQENRARTLESGRIRLQRLRKDLKNRESRVINDCDALRIDFEQHRGPGGEL